MPDRLFDLPGSLNLRDFGGHATRDGRCVRRGRLLRSGGLKNLSTGAVESLRRLPVHTICDLRRTEERALHPNPSFGPGCRVFEWATSTETSPLRDRQFVEAASMDVARTAMVGMYARLPYLLQPRLRGAFDAIVHAGEGATIIHCAAGKDRTGVAVALVLESLGVPRETIMDDYLQTNTAVDLEARLHERNAAGAGLATTASPILALPDVARRAVLEAHPTYLQAAYDAIEARDGSVARYLERELNVDASMLTELRSRLLE